MCISPLASSCCCSVLQCVAVRCRESHLSKGVDDIGVVLQIRRIPRDAMCCSVLQCVVVCCNTLQSPCIKLSLLCVAVCCSALQCVVVCCRAHLAKALTIHCNTLQHIAMTHCNTLQHTALHCNTLQHTATHCNTLQHPATPCNTLQHAATH